MCRERPQRGCLRARRVPEECPASVSALIDACIQGAEPALRPSAYEAFRGLAARCGHATCDREVCPWITPCTASLGVYIQCTACEPLSLFRQENANMCMHLTDS